MLDVALPPSPQHAYRSIKFTCEEEATVSLLFICFTLFLVNCSSPEFAGPPPSQGHFVDVAPYLGLIRPHTGGGPEKRYIIEAKGGGAALLDFDDDGDLDIYWVNGATLEAPDSGAGNALYRNDGTGGFVDVAAAQKVMGRGWGMGAISADYDNDGDADLYVTNLRHNILYRNEGHAGGFSDVSSLADVAMSQWSTGSAFADYDLDGDLDLYVSSYAVLDTSEIAPLGTQWKGVAAFVGPLGLEPAPDVFYRNRGDGTFVAVTAEAGLDVPTPGYGFAVLFADDDDDGDPDIFVANDSSPNFLFRNEGSGRFSDQSLRTNTAYGEMGNSQAGMGASWGDYNGDGHADIVVTNFEDDYNTLYRNNGEGRFTDVSFSAGFAQPSLNYVGFGVNFMDFDNDSDLDIFVANGHVYPAIGAGGTGATYAQPDHLFENLGNGSFALLSPVAPDTAATRVSRGSCAGDLDGDGDLDLFVSNLNDRPALLRNDVGNNQNWVAFQLLGSVSNRDAIGARVWLFSGGNSQVRDILCGSSFLCSEDRRAHFGLGSATRIDSVKVRWPSGIVQRLEDLQINTYIIIEETESALSTPPDAEVPKSSTGRRQSIQEGEI